MPGIWGLQLTTIGAICTMYQRRVCTAFWDQPNYSHNLSPNAHLKALTKELQTTMATVAKTTKGRRLIQSLATAIKAILTPKNAGKQRVDTDIGIEIPNKQEAPISTIQRISDVLEIMQARDPTAK